LSSLNRAKRNFSHISVSSIRIFQNRRSYDLDDSCSLCPNYVWKHAAHDPLTGSPAGRRTGPFTPSDRRDRYYSSGSVDPPAVTADRATKHVVEVAMALRAFRGSALLWPLSRRLRQTMLTSLAAVGLAVSAGACTSSSSTSSAPASSASGKVGGSLTVWVDSVRLPVAQAYAKAHPNVHVRIVTFDGDGNGATTMQTKIQLWNR